MYLAVSCHVLIHFYQITNTFVFDVICVWYDVCMRICLHCINVYIVNSIGCFSFSIFHFFFFSNFVGALHLLHKCSLAVKMLKMKVIHDVLVEWIYSVNKHFYIFHSITHHRSLNFLLNILINATQLRYLKVIWNGELMNCNTSESCFRNSLRRR